MKNDVYFVMPAVKLIFGILSTENKILPKYLSRFEAIWGEIDYQSEAFVFSETSYYEAEMGKEIYRIFLSFSRFIDADDLAEIKWQTILLENEWKSNGGRKINIDPGYLDMDKLVLASTKYGRQKISIGKAMWADPVLYFYKKSFHSFDWSFPDFKSDKYYSVFNKLRALYKMEIKNAN